MNIPKISIITVVFNGEKLIERTIKSVLSQTYSNIEYIIIDGASTDGTLTILEQFKTNIAKIISEKDKGIYDAMNKGLEIASGDYILFLNAGDELFDPQTITKVFVSSVNADVYYGNTIITDVSGNHVGNRRLTPPPQLTWKSLKYGMCVSHQSFIAKRLLCDPYNLKYSISSDIDWVISVLKKSNKIVNTQIYIAKFLEGGASKQHKIKALQERFNIMVKHYGFFQTLLNHLYILVRYPIHSITHKNMS